MMERLNPPAENIRVYTPAQKWLVGAMLLLGLYFQWAVKSEGRLLYGLFFLICLGAAAALNWKRFLKSPAAIFAAVCYLVIAALSAFHPNRGIDELDSLNLAALPLLAMLAAVLASTDYTVKREGAVAIRVLCGYTVYPFRSVGRFFGAGFAAVRSAGKGRGRSVLFGVLIALPIVALVLFLLSRADAVVGKLLNDLFFRFDLPDFFFRAALTLLCAMFVYSVMFSLTWGNEKPLPYRPAALPVPVLGIALGTLILIYAAFASMQFAYLFGGKLPVEYTYAEYARRGFGELMGVSAINFVLFGLSLRYTKPSKVMTALTALLLAATATLLASAATRLLLYIGAYGLTFMRILPLWFMVYLAFLTVLCAVRLIREKTPLLLIASSAFLVWYVALNIPDWAKIIADSFRA